MPDVESQPEEVKSEDVRTAELESTQEVPVLKRFTSADLSLFWDEVNDED